MERMIGRVCSLQHHYAIEPRLRRPQLGGKGQQGRHLTVAAGEMHANRAAAVGCMRDGQDAAEIAAAAPPDEPPGECSSFQGLWQEPKSRGSVLGFRPNSGVELRPMNTRPAFLQRVT
jgi:hypothetical protein